MVLGLEREKRSAGEKMKWLFALFQNKNHTVKIAGGITTAALVPAAVFLGMTSPIGSPMTAEFEGLVLKNYHDVVGVETWCYGETQVGRLKSGYTKEYCQTLFNQSYNKYSAKLYECYDDTAKRYVTPAMHAAFVDVFYNTGAKCNTGMIRNLKEGRPVDACNFTKNYKMAGGKDCSIRSNNCYGVYDRRLKFLPLCLKDAEQIPQEGIGQ